MGWSSYSLGLVQQAAARHDRDARDRLLLEKLRKALRENALDPTDEVHQMRATFEASSAKMRPADGVSIAPARLGPVTAEELAPPLECSPNVILYLHGGGYCLGSLASVRALASRVCLHSRCRVFALDYALAPESPCPRAIDDVLAAYDALAAGQVDPGRVFLVGDSAGGGLAVAAAIAIRDSGRPHPAGVAGLSPCVDMTLPGESVEVNADNDPAVTRALLARMAALYAGPDLDPTDPRVSPINAELAGLPPVLVQVGSGEALRDDVVRFAELARAAAVDIECQVWPEMLHVWHMFAPRLAAANDALDSVGRWISDKTHPGPGLVPLEKVPGPASS